MGTLNPLEVFSMEVWKTIFEKLGGQRGCSTNLLNCSRVCTEFENALITTQSQWLFETICPLNFPYLKGKELLACRRVCKGWCRVVDNFLEDFEARRPFNEDTSDISRSYLDNEKNVECTKLRHVTEISEFIKVMKNSKNPPKVPEVSL